MPKHLSGPRHRIDSKTTRRAAVTVGGMLASSSAIAGASIVAVIAAGGTYAMWNDSVNLNAGTIESGSTGLTVNDVASYTVDSAVWSKLLPGDVVSRQVMVKNTGTVPGVVSAATSGSFDPLLVHVAKGTCPVSPAGPISGPSSTMAIPTNLGVFAVGEASIVCLQVTMPANAANVQGANQNFTVTFTSTTGS